MKNFKFKISLVFYCFIFYNQSLYSQLFVQQGNPISLICINNIGDYGVGTWNWSFNPCSGDVTSNSQSFNVNNITINSTNCCNITSTASGDLVDIYSYQFFFMCQENLKILPKINAISGSKFPGNTFAVDASSGGSSTNGLSCASAHGCPGATITWAVTGAGSSNCLFSPCVNVTVPNPPTSNVITVNGTYNCNGVNSALVPITINVVLQNPTVTGPQSIGCGSSPSYVTNGQVTFNASNVTGAGGSNWVWSWPSFMSPVGSTNGQSIVLNVNGPGSGNVTVQAFSPNGQVSSAIVNFPVNVCCTPVINESTILNSSNTGYLIEAGSTINSTNDIQSTGTATMHAGVEVRLLPGFNSVAGSQAHLYIAACNSGYSRMALNQYTTAALNNSSEVNTSTLSSSQMEYNLSKAETKKQDGLKITESSNFFNVSPNPTNGNVIVYLNTQLQSPMAISVIDALGTIIYHTTAFESDKFVIDLTNYSNGMYVIKAIYNDEVVSKVILKTD